MLDVRATTPMYALHYAPDFEGMEDFVMIDSSTRTIFSTFSTFYDYWESGTCRWNTPAESDISSAKVAGIDPFYNKESILAAEYCHKHRIPYVTIDEKPENEMVKYASIVAVSSEYIRDNLSEYSDDKEGKTRLLNEYAKHTNALIIITSGSNTTFYSRKGCEIKKLQPFKIDVVSTLGAGDSFRAGCVYSLLQGYDDDKIVKFASALAAVACTKFPLGLNPPTLEEVERLMKER